MNIWQEPIYLITHTKNVLYSTSSYQTLIDINSFDFIIFPRLMAHFHFTGFI